MGNFHIIMNIEYIDNEIKIAKIRIRELENLKEAKLKDDRDRIS